MAAVLRITSDPADVRAMFGALVDAAQKANRQLSGIEATHKREYDKTLAEEKRAAIRAANEKLAAEKKAARDREKLDKDQQRRSAALAKEETRLADKTAKDKSKIAQREAREAENLAKAKLRMQERLLREETQAAEREARNQFAYQRRKDAEETALAAAGFRRRLALARQNQRDTARLVGQASSFGRSVAGGALQIASSVHGDIQDVRQRRAAQETDLNTILIQRGSSAAENASSRARIRDYARENHLDLGTTIDALREAQGKHNALGGRNEGERGQALDQTLRDVSFASLIDPNNTTGLTTFSAMLRQQGVGNETRSQMLRSAAGMSFSGSVEAEDALRSGLPGMLRTVSSLTANASPQQRESITRDVMQDFFAQLQTVAATGGRVGVTANRIGTLRTALNNQNTQNDLGAALNARTMTADQRTEFGHAFTQGPNGQWQMNQAMANSPSEAAALFGHLFNNDATAISNFLGTRGGNIHSTKQMLTKPASDLMTSYLAMGTDAQGNQVRQYDAVRSLREQTITPEQERQIKDTRATEDRNNLIDNENSRSQALGDNTSALNRASAALDKLAAEHPILAAAGNTLGTGVAIAGAGRIMGLGGRAVSAGGQAIAATETGAAVNTIGAAGGATGLGAMFAGGAAALLGGLAIGDVINRLTSKKGEEGIGSVTNPATWSAFASAIGDVFRSNPPVVRINPGDAAIVAAQHANATTPAQRNGTP